MRQKEALTPLIPSMAMPSINQREVYLLPFPFGSSQGEDHPHIVLSIKDANEHESTFLAVMITTSKIHRDELSFELTNEMFDKPLQKENSHVRMHLIMLVLNSEIRGKIGKPLCTMKKQYFDQLMKSIGEFVFNYEFIPL